MAQFNDKRTLLLSSPNINMFFTKYSNDSAIQDSMIYMIDNICYNANIFLDTASKQHDINDTTTLLTHFNTLQTQNELFRTELKQDLTTFSKQITEDIKTQFGQHVLSINSIIDVAVSKINPKFITEQIRETLLEQTSNGIKQNEQFILNNILEPVISTQQQFYDNFSKLINNGNITQPIIEQFNKSSEEWMTHLQNIIVSIKTIETTVDSDDKKNVLENIISELNKNIAVLNTSINQISINTKDVNVIKSTVDSIITKVERIKDDNLIHNTKSIKTAKVKGNIAEDKLFLLLQDHLPSRDNFTVQQVSGAPHSADILISRTDYPNIRIESKNYNDTYISYSQVEKFKRDLIERDNHGIFVSISTKISNKGDIDIEQLINGKFAIYISNNNYDVDFIINLVYFIYKLDSIFTTSKSDIIICPDTVLRIKDFIFSTRETLKSMKERLRMMLNDVSRIDMDVLDNILLQQVKSNDDSNISLICNSCQFTAKNKRGLNIHKAKCDNTNTIDTYISN